MSGPIAEELRDAAPPDARSALGQTGTVSAAGSFHPTGATGSFAPIGDEFIADVAPDEIYVDDADDSHYSDTYTESGAFAGPGYVDMPKSYPRRFLSKLGFGKRKEKEEKNSAQGWNEVDEEEDNNWQGGAYSNQRSIVDRGTQEDQENTFVDPDFSYESVEEDDLGQIFEFRAARFDTEIWFVSLGAELANNAGMNAFIAEHSQDLRGSIIINLEGLGSGSLSLIESEGTYRQTKASSRLGRFTKKASQITGLPIKTATIPWKNSAASVAQKKGYQAMSLVGMDSLKPSKYAQRDDILENINREALLQNVDFVIETLKSI
jgi:hypothetical protein